MNIGVVNEDVWDFFHEVYADFQAHYATTLFQRRVTQLPILNARVNERRLERDLTAFLQSQQVVFFEWAGDLLAQISHMPKSCGLVVRIHRYDLYRWLDAVNWSALDQVILVSEAKRREFARRLPEHAHKVVVIPEAVSVEKFAFKPKPFAGRLGILCHLTARKRVYDLILDFYEVVQQRPDLHLVIGGDERPLHRDYYEAMQVLLDRLALRPYVTFQGHITDNQAWYENVDVFISNSYSEGLQVSPMEAMASGVYCLSHHWDGADELLPEENLYLTGRQFQERLLNYVNMPEPEKQQRLAMQRDRVLTHFNMEQIKRQIRDVVEAVGAQYGAN